MFKSPQYPYLYKKGNTLLNKSIQKITMNIKIDYLGEFLARNSKFSLDALHYLGSSITFADNHQKRISEILNLLVLIRVFHEMVNMNQSVMWAKILLFLWDLFQNC